MKNRFKLFIFQAGRMFSFLYPLTLNKRLFTIKTLLYTAWIANLFKNFGKNSIVYKHLTLIGGKYISIGAKSVIGKNAVLSAWDKYEDQTFCPEIIIGDECNIGEYCHISATNKITFGKNVLTGRWLTIVDNVHGKSTQEDIKLPPVKRHLYSKGPVIIGDNVLIGDKVTILPGVIVGENCIIGANSVVVKNVPANSVVSGNPAKIIKHLF